MKQPYKHGNAWKGGRYRDSRGYIVVWVGPGQYEREHRLVMQEILGRPLLPGEQVHHKNGDNSDNRPENLELHTASSHTKHHWDKGDLAKHHIQRPPADCHPERPHYGKGLCRQCYMNAAQKRYVARHPDRRRARKRKRYKKLKAMGYSRAELRRLV